MVSNLKTLYPDGEDTRKYKRNDDGEKILYVQTEDTRIPLTHNSRK